MNSFKPTLLLVILVWILTFFTLNLAAQDLISNGRMAGMGYSSEALIHGVDALGVNPALIGLPKGSVVSIAILPLSFQAGTDFFDYATYEKYFVGQFNEETGKREGYQLTDADKAVILNAFQDNAGDFTLNASVKLFGLTVSTSLFDFGLHMADKVGTRGAIPRDFIEFLLYGNTPGKTFDLSETSMYSTWTREYGLTVAKKFELFRKGGPTMTFGAAVKMIHGFGYFGIEEFNSRFTTDPEHYEVTGQSNMRALYTGTDWIMNKNIFAIQLFPEPVGNGIGVDLGVVASFSDRFRVGFSLVDLGGMTWDRNTYEISANEIFTLADISDDEQVEEIKKKLAGSERSISSFSSSLPTAATLSASFSVLGFFGSSSPLYFASALRQGFNDLPGNSTTPRFSVGLEWELIESLPLRGGLSVGGDKPFQASVGLGLIMDSMTVDVATSNLETFFGETFSSASIAITTRLDF